MSLAFFVPGRVQNLTNTRGHWSGRHRYSSDWRGLVKAHALRVLAEHGPVIPTRPKRITLTATVRRRLDQDGLRAALKPVVDALQIEREIRKRGVLVGWHIGAGIIHHDGPGCGHVFEYDQVLAAGKPTGVMIQIEPLDGRCDVAKITMAEYGNLAAEILAKPRKVRLMLEEALRKKRAAEEAEKNGTAAGEEIPAGGAK